jgi:hypothetical protein
MFWQILIFDMTNEDWEREFCRKDNNEVEEMRDVAIIHAKNEFETTSFDFLPSSSCKEMSDN